MKNKRRKFYDEKKLKKNFLEQILILKKKKIKIINK